jgi:hypothetical protein
MITAFYAALLGLGLIWMSWRVIAQRRQMRVSLGDGGDKVLVKRIRAHANFVEYVPLGLILLGLVEWHWKLPWLAHGVGATLLIGRVLHAVAFSAR